MSELAVLVRKEASESALETLRELDNYDDSRAIEAHSTTHLAIPVLEEPAVEQLPAFDLLEDAGLAARTPDLQAQLRERGWSDDAIERAPSSWAVVGDIILLEFGACERKADVATELLELHGEAETVLERNAIDGPHREPDVSVVAGAGQTETVHTEHGTQYAIDFDSVMFSPGNEAERRRMGETVSTGERVLDMFAGIGYFALPMARAGATVTAVERNPESYRLLVENTVLNGVENQLSAMLADCRAVEAPAERIVMGHFDAVDYLDTALSTLDSGGVVHLHDTTSEDALFEAPLEAIDSEASAQGRDTELLECHRVKSYAEGVAHVVVDVRVE